MLQSEPLMVTKPCLESEPLCGTEPHRSSEPKRKSLTHVAKCANLSEPVPITEPKRQERAMTTEHGRLNQAK